MQFSEMTPHDSVSSVALDTMSTDQLRGELARSLQLNAQQLLHLAAVWRELERRGEDLSDLRTGMGAYLSMIAAGRLDANAVVRFSGQPTLLRALVDLPVERQRAIASDQPISVISIDSSGEPELVTLPAYSLTAAQVRQVFAPGRLRDASEQEAVLRQTVSRKRIARAAAGPATRVRHDVSEDVLIIGRHRIPAADVLAALASTGRDDDDGIDAVDKPKVIPVNLSEQEHRKMRVRAAESGESMTGMVRMAMRRAGLI